MRNLASISGFSLFLAGLCLVACVKLTDPSDSELAGGAPTASANENGSAGETAGVGGDGAEDPLLTNAGSGGASAGAASAGAAPTGAGSGGTLSGGAASQGGSQVGGGAGGVPVVGVNRGRAPSGEIVMLYEGEGFEHWQGVLEPSVEWAENSADGYMEVVPGSKSIITNAQNLHEDVFLHVEFWNPNEPDDQTGQHRGNSGIYLQSRFEVQVLDSFGNPPQADGCGAIYEVKAPLVNACKPAEEWNTYEIFYTAPRYEGEERVSNAEFTVWLNDQLVQDKTRVDADSTRAGTVTPPGPAPLMLQEHSDRVRYRNIWWVHLNR